MFGQENLRTIFFLVVSSFICIFTRSWTLRGSQIDRSVQCIIVPVAIPLLRLLEMATRYLLKSFVPVNP